MKTNPEKTAHIEQDNAREAWSKPQLLDYGKVADLTEGGYLNSDAEDTLYTSVA
ncbi:hypothetical protein [Thiohalocapsa marina]|uniref:hypothetical protein n=1 Tax=Thiohalocapsa marina TaxID=424902 RepID=UPI00147907D7|nr:hypothetical protein [Thiohalocapsa marina]